MDSSVSFPNKENFFFFLTNFIHQSHNDQDVISHIQEFWLNMQQSQITDPLVVEAQTLSQNLYEDFQHYITTLQAQLLPESPSRSLSSAPKEFPDPDRIYMDGCFDLMHSGHFNAIRQAKALGKILVIGIHSDQEIILNKGPPVMNERERYAMVRACKWADEIIEDAPYSPTIELLDSLNCRYAAHGDDTSLNADGTDCFSIMKNAGRCKIFKRTEGISTTQLVGKLLLMTRDDFESVAEPTTTAELIKKNEQHSLTTSRRISEFSTKREPNPGDRIVYIDGTFDLFHIGHVEILQKAKEMGDFLIVGIHDDQTVNRYKGSNFPIMSLHDRVLCVLSMRVVDEVVIGAPWKVTQDLLTSLNISCVVQGSVHKGDAEGPRWRKGSVDIDDSDPYEVPKALGLYTEILSPSSLDTNDIISRIVENRMRFFSKYERTSAREEKYLKEIKGFVQEVQPQELTKNGVKSKGASSARDQKTEALGPI